MTPVGTVRRSDHSRLDRLASGARVRGCTRRTMFEEGQLYSPVTEGDDGEVTVHLAHDHPGAPTRPTAPGATRSPRAALRWRPGEPTPDVGYTEAEHEVWRTVCRELRPKHEQLRDPRVRRGARRASPCRPTTSPNLDEVSERVEPLTGFRYVPAAGLVPLREFYGSLRDRLLPLHAVRPPRRRAALHARAGHHPRGHRPRAPARDADVLRAAPPDRRGDPPPARRGEPALPLAASSGSPSSSASSSRTASCARTAPGSSPPTARSRSSATWSTGRSTSSRWAPPTTTSPHYQPVLYRAESLDEVREVVGGFFAHLHRRVDRRDAGARARAGLGLDVLVALDARLGTPARTASSCAAKARPRNSATALRKVHSSTPIVPAIGP